MGSWRGKLSAWPGRRGKLKIEAVASEPAKQRIEALGFFPGAVVEAEKLGPGEFALSGEIQPKTAFSREAASLVEVSEVAAESQKSKWLNKLVDLAHFKPRS